MHRFLALLQHLLAQRLDVARVQRHHPPDIGLIDCRTRRCAFHNLTRNCRQLLAQNRIQTLHNLRIVIIGSRSAAADNPLRFLKHQVAVAHGFFLFRRRKNPAVGVFPVIFFQRVQRRIITVILRKSLKDNKFAAFFDTQRCHVSLRRAFIGIGYIIPYFLRRCKPKLCLRHT